MVGFDTKINPEDEAEKRQINEMALSIESAIIRLNKLANIGATARCEAATGRLAEVLKNPKLPRKFCDESRRAIDALMLHAFMKATDIAAKAAIDAAMEDDPDSRANSIREARENLRGAMKYKAPREFQLKCERMIETALLTGGVKAKGPTKAKPLDVPAEGGKTEEAADTSSTVRSARKSPPVEA